MKSIFRFTKSTIYNQRGYSLVELLVAAGIAGAVVLGTSSIFIDSTKIETSQERQFWIAARRMEFQSMIRSPKGWEAVVTNNPGMACIGAGTSCAAVSSPQPLRMPIDSTVLEGSSATLGMSNKGDFCNTFDATNGNGACPVGVRLSWMAICDNAQCLHAQPKIFASFQIKEPGKPLQESKSNDLVVFKDPKVETLNQVCAAMGGTLAGGLCSVPATQINCVNPGEFPYGFNSEGVVLCRKPLPGSCAAKDVAVGFDNKGNIQCSPACH